MVVLVRKLMNKTKRKIAIIGYGAIAEYVFSKLKSEKIIIDYVICRKGKEKKAKAVFKNNIQVINSIEKLTYLPDLILDCAGHSALREFAPKSLSLGIDFITLSSGALADEKLFNKINRASKLSNGNFYVASGAIGSLDVLSAAKVGGLSKVTYIGRKPPKGWVGSRAEEILNMKNLKGKINVHFSGNARDAALLYPKNANVAASVALAGLGFDKTIVKLIADSTIEKNIHELEIEGKFGVSNFIIKGLTLPSNPKSSSLAAMSMVSEVKKVLGKS